MDLPKSQKPEKFDENLMNRRLARKLGLNKIPGYINNNKCNHVLLDDNLLELTDGRPFPLKHRAKIFFDKSIANDTEFLSVVNVVDYSILVGFDEEKHELVIGILDYIRQYDLQKKFESLGKSVGMIAGQAEPTIIQPIQYCKRFNEAMERYFMAVPDHWSFSNEANSNNNNNNNNGGNGSTRKNDNGGYNAADDNITTGTGTGTGTSTYAR